MQIVLYAFAALLLAAPAVGQDDFAVPPAPHMEDYYKPGLAPVRSDPGADVTIVYFSDYQCPSCRKYSPDVNSVFGADRKLRVIYRDTPIFGPRSEEAARFAIASQFQGKHEAFHRALMAQALPLDEPAIRAAATRAGVDWNRLLKDRARHAKAIDAQIAQNMNLSEAAGISGTPAFIIGKTLANGAMDAAGLRAEIADARATATPSTAAPPAPAIAAKSDNTDEQAAAVGNEQEADPNAAVTAAVPPPKAPMFEPSGAASAPDDTAAPAPPNRRLPLIVGGAIVVLGALGLLWVRRRRRLL